MSNQPQILKFYYDPEHTKEVAFTNGAWFLLLEGNVLMPGERAKQAVYVVHKPTRPYHECILRSIEVRGDARLWEPVRQTRMKAGDTLTFYLEWFHDPAKEFDRLTASIVVSGTRIAPGRV